MCGQPEGITGCWLGGLGAVTGLLGIGSDWMVLDGFVFAPWLKCLVTWFAAHIL